MTGEGLFNEARVPKALKYWNPEATEAPERGHVREVVLTVIFLL